MTTAEVTAVLERQKRLPKAILSDHSSQFKAPWWRWCSQHGIEAYFAHPSSRSMVHKLPNFKWTTHRRSKTNTKRPNQTTSRRQHPTQTPETTDHAVFLISDKSVMPQRKEIRVIKQLQNLKEDAKTLSNTTNTYWQQTKIKTIGILICDKVTDDMLNTLKTLPTTQEIVLMPTNQTQTTETEP